MAIKDIIKGRKSDNQINRVEQFSYSNWMDIFNNPATKKYSDVYSWIIFNTIFSGIRNVEFYCKEDDSVYFSDIQKIVSFLDRYAIALVWQMWSLGFMCLGIDKQGKLYIPKPNAIRKDSNGNVSNFDIVLYSDTYMFSGKSDFDILKNDFSYLDKTKNGMEYLTEHFGAFAFLCGKGMPLNAADKEEFVKNIKDKYGISREKMQLYPFTNEIDIKQLDLSVDKLDLSGKINDEIKTILAYFRIPYEMVAISGQSTYANREQAIKDFYSNCISPIAEDLLKIGRYVIRKNRKLMIPSEILTWRIINVSELEDDRSGRIDFDLKVVSLIEKMKNLGLDTEEYENILKEKSI